MSTANHIEAKQCTEEMAFSYRIYPEEALIVITLTGAVSAEDIMSVMQAYASDPNWTAGDDRLWDARGVTGLDLVPEDVNQVREHSSELLEHTGTGRLAVVAARKLDEQISRIFRLVLTHIEIEVFRDVDQALAWLGKSLGAEDLRA